MSAPPTLTVLSLGAGRGIGRRHRTANYKGSRTASPTGTRDTVGCH